MSLGQAFIDVRFRTLGAEADLERQVNKIIKAIETKASIAPKVAASGSPAAATAKAAEKDLATVAKAFANIQKLGDKVAAQTAARARAAAAAETEAARTGFADRFEIAKNEARAVLAEQQAAYRKSADLQRAYDRARAESARTASEAIRKAELASSTPAATNAQQAKKAKLTQEASTAVEAAARAAKAEAAAEQTLSAALSVEAELAKKAAAANELLARSHRAAGSAAQAAAGVAPKSFAPGNSAGVTQFQGQAAKAAEAEAKAELAAHTKAQTAISNLYKQQAKAAENAAAAEQRAIKGTATAFANLQKLGAKLAATQTKAVNEATAALDREARSAASVAAAQVRAAEAVAKARAESARNFSISNPGSTPVQRATSAVESTAAARNAAAAQIAFAKEVSASAEVEASAMAAAWKAAYAEDTAAARAAARAQIASAAEIKKANSKTFAGSFAKQFEDPGKGLGKSIANSIKGIPKDLFGVVTNSAKYATIGVLGLGAAMVGIGLESASKIQNAQTGFAALAEQIVGSKAAVDSFKQSIDDVNTGLTKEQSIGNDFVQQLIKISNASSISQAELFKASQQLLALDLNGQQAKGVILDVSNALAASGKNGGQLNDDLDGVVVAFSQISGAGRLLAQDLNQITTRIPSVSRTKVYEQLAKDLNLVSQNAKHGSKELTDAALAVGKMQKEGKITSAEAIPALLKVIKQVPGAYTELGTALDRQNQTLAGRFEALKDNIRTALGNAFIAPSGPGGKGFADSLADQVKDLTDALTGSDGAITKIAPKLQAFTSEFVSVLIKLLPQLAVLIGKTFDGLGKAFKAIDSVLPRIAAGFRALSAALSAVNFGPALKNALEAIAKLVPLIVTEFAGMLVAITPIIDALASVLRIVEALGGPFVKGIAASFAAIGIALAPLAELLRPVADFIEKIANSTAGQVILGIAGAMAGVVLAANAAALAIGAITAAFATLDLALAANPIGIAVVGLVALAGAFIYAWKNSETFRDVVTAVIKVVLQTVEVFVKLFVGQFQLILGAIQLFIEGLAKMADAASHLPLIGGKFKGIADGLHAAADGVGDLNGKLGSAVDGISNLADGLNRSSAGLSAQARSISAFNDALGLTGANALSSAADMVELQSAINALPEEKRISVEVAIFTSIGKANTDFLNSRGVPLTGLEDATGFSTEGIQDAAKKAASAASNAGLNAGDAYLKELQKALGGGAGSSTGSGKKSAGQTAGEAAANTFKKNIADIIASLDKEFKSGLVTGTVKQIDTALDGLTKKIRDTFASAKRKPPSGLLKDIQADNVKLKALAKERDKILSTLKAAQDKFNDVVNSVKSDSNIVELAKSLDQLGESASSTAADLSHLRIIKPGQDALGITKAAVSATQANAQAIADTLSKQLSSITAFQANIDKLIKAGLNKTTIDQIISAGVAGGGSTAQALAGASASTIAQINATQKGIDAAAKKLGNTAADSLFRSGKDVVSGLIAGLKDKRDEIKAAMKDIADTLVAEIKKRLKIKSPSRRMWEEAGRHVIPGIVKDMGGQHGLLGDAMTAVSNKLAGTTLAAPKVAELQASAQRQAMAELKAVVQPDGAWTRNDISRLHAGIEAIPGAPGLPGRVITPTPPLAMPAVVRPTAAQFATRRAR